MKHHVLLFILLGTLSSLSKQAIAANVIVKAVEMERAKEQVQAVGNTEAIRSVILYPAVGDRVTALHFKPGDKVKAGQVLLELDSRRQKAALEEAGSFGQTLVTPHQSGRVRLRVPRAC